MEKKLESRYHLHSNKPYVVDSQDFEVMGRIQMDIDIVIGSMQGTKYYIHLDMEKVKREVESCKQRM